MKTLISIDGGMSTGIIVGTYSDDTPFELTHAFQIERGVEGFVTRFDFRERTLHSKPVNRVQVLNERGWSLCDVLADDILVEKFSARGTAAGPFALRTEALEPLRIEGALLAMGVTPTWVSPPQQYFLPGKDKTEKKKRQHAWLRENGYAIMPKDLGTKDADDARSALAHCISWLRKFHKPTQELFRKDENEA